TLHKIGIELELFCINSNTLKNVPYQTGDGNISIQRLFEHLKTHEGYASLDSTKTFGVQKGESKIGLEPGSQFELSSTAYKTLDDLLQDFRAYIGMLQRLSHEFHINWLDVAYFPVGKP